MGQGVHSFTTKRHFTFRKALVAWPYVLVAALSLTLNWFVQLTYYLITIHRNPVAFNGERTLFDYTTGVIGDALLLPIVNVIILYVLVNLRPKLTKLNYLYIVASGVCIDIALNFLQGYLRLTNWSMPKPFQWNFVSYWHMASFLLQISFVLLFFYMYVVARQTPQLSTKIARAMHYVLALMGIFVLLFLYDYLPKHMLIEKVAFVIHRMPH